MSAEDVAFLRELWDRWEQSDFSTVDAFVVSRLHLPPLSVNPRVPVHLTSNGIWSPYRSLTLVIALTLARSGR